MTAAMRLETLPPRRLVGLSEQHAGDQAAATIGAQWERLFSYWPLPGQQGDVAFGVMLSTSPDAVAYFCGVASAAEPVPAPLVAITLPAADYAVFWHAANIREIGRTWNEIYAERLPGAALQPADSPPFERYDERFDGATGDGGIEVWVPVITTAAN